MSGKISCVQAANIKDERTSEILRRELYDLMHLNGWNLKSLYEAFNKHRETCNERPIHINNFKTALSGIKKHRPLADQIEKFISANAGPYISITDKDILIDAFSHQPLNC